MSRHIAARPGLGVCAHIVQERELNFAQIRIDQPALIQVLKGAKTLQPSRGGLLRVGAGEAVAIGNGQTLDITNHPAADGGYEARWIIFDAGLVQAWAQRRPPGPPARNAWLVGPLEEGFQAAFDRARQTIVAPDPLPLEVAQHHVEELLIWLALRGVSFDCTAQATTASRVRHLLAGALDQPWNAPDIARALAMSEATLRRRLADEGVSLSELLVDTRMSFALTLLQSTDRPIAGIALDVGYESPSRFAVRFRKRFGFAPSAIRGHQRDDADLEGTAAFAT